MERIIIALLAILAFSASKAQEISTLTVPYENGTLTFEYYEKDGIKIPHGHMKYEEKKFIKDKAEYPYIYRIEEGNNNDGYREGVWIFKSFYIGSEREINMTFKNGLLEDTLTFSKWESNSPKPFDTNVQREDYSSCSYSFSKGHLVGENIIKYTEPRTLFNPMPFSRTIYSYVSDSGKCIGTWKRITGNDTRFYHFNEDGKADEVYEVDVIGRKKFFPNETASLDLSHINSMYAEITIYRVSLPTLGDCPYGVERTYIEFVPEF